MKASICRRVALIAALVASCSVDAKIVKPQRAIDEAELMRVTSSPAEVDFNLRNFIMAWKGAMDGYQKGFYGDERIKLTDDCFGDETQSDLIFCDKFINGL